MSDLKPFLDKAKADSEEVIRLQNEVSTLFNNGTDEGIQAAIDLQPALVAATAKADESNNLYLAMRNADQNSGSAASLFVSAPGKEEEPAEEKKMTLAAFNAMPPRERLKFSKAGGRLEG